MNIKFKKVKQVKSPNIGTAYSAGIDLYVPSFSDEFKMDFCQKNDPLQSTLLSNPRDNKIAIYPHCRALIPSGLIFNMIDYTKKFDNFKFALIAHNKSGVSTVYGLDALACVIDEDCQGEVHISLVNTSNQTVYIHPDEKIIQVIPMAIPNVSLEEADEDEILFYRSEERGTGGFGSTGK